MTNEASRSRALVVMLGVFVPLTVVATATTPDNRLGTAAMLTVAFTVLILLVMGLWSYRPAWVARWLGPLTELDLADRQLVIRAVRSGEAVVDPRLTQVAASVAGRTIKRAWLVIGMGGLMLGIRAWSLAHSHSTVGGVLGVVNAAIWLGYLVYGIRLRSRARKAEAANLATLAQV